MMSKNVALLFCVRTQITKQTSQMVATSYVENSITLHSEINFLTPNIRRVSDPQPSTLNHPAPHGI